MTMPQRLDEFDIKTWAAKVASETLPGRWGAEAGGEYLRRILYNKLYNLWYEYQGAFKGSVPDIPTLRQYLNYSLGGQVTSALKPVLDHLENSQQQATTATNQNVSDNTVSANNTKAGKSNIETAKAIISSLPKGNYTVGVANKLIAILEMDDAAYAADPKSSANLRQELSALQLEIRRDDTNASAIFDAIKDHQRIKDVLKKSARIGRSGIISTAQSPAVKQGMADLETDVERHAEERDVMIRVRDLLHQAGSGTKDRKAVLWFLRDLQKHVSDSTYPTLVNLKLPESAKVIALATYLVENDIGSGGDLQHAYRRVFLGERTLTKKELSNFLWALSGKLLQSMGKTPHAGHFIGDTAGDAATGSGHAAKPAVYTGIMGNLNNAKIDIPGLQKALNDHQVDADEAGRIISDAERYRSWKSFMQSRANNDHIRLSGRAAMAVFSALGLFRDA